MVEEVSASGCVVLEPEEGGVIDRATRRMPLRIAIDPPTESRLMREEIFGPILPVVPYDRLEDAIAFINNRDRPLGLYAFGDEQATNEIARRTVSGGLAINACAMQGALPNMGFGGVGLSGTGRHHGIEGFREFSNPRGTFVRGRGDLIDEFYPPYLKPNGGDPSASG